MKNLVFIGAPGSGKGTQSNKVSSSLGHVHISTGDLLRSEISKKTELGIKVQSLMESGQLVSDELVVELLKSNLDLERNSYIFDGYPRNIKQAQTLDLILASKEYLAIYFKLDTDLLVERLTNRRVTKNGKHIYNLLTNPPIVDGVCDVTGEVLVHRDDDKEEVIRNRMSIFEETIGPLLNFYETKGNLVVVNASLSVEEVYSEITSRL